jgi:putative ABC transport system permease protein
MTFTKSAVALRTVHFPFPARAIFTGQLGLLPDVLGSADRRARFAADVLQRIEAVPGVTAAALVSVLPGKGAGNLSFSLDAPGTGSPAARPTAGLALVTPEFFAVLGASARRGRLLSWQDAPTAPAVAVVNDSWVRRFSPDREPLGRRVWFGETGLEIVGVVPDLQMQDPEDHDAAGVYASLLQLRPYVIRVMARASGDPMALTAGVRAAVETVDPDVPLFETARLHDAIYADKKVLDVFGTLFAVFGAGALFMTVVGLYGLVSFAVTRRTREIGVRVALGAAPRNVVALVLRHGAAVIGLGTASGLLIAFTVSRVLAATLEPIEPAGALSYAAITGILVAASLIGLLRPVGRALALEPVAALRAE